MGALGPATPRRNTCERSSMPRWGAPALGDSGPASSEAAHRPHLPERRSAPARRGQNPLLSLLYRRGVAGPRARYEIRSRGALLQRAPMGDGPVRTPSESLSGHRAPGEFFDSSRRQPIRSAGLVWCAERWPSGLRQRFAKPSYGVNLYRGFESPPLRQFFEPRRRRSERRRAGSMRLKRVPP